MHTTQFPALVHCIFLAVTVFPSRQPAKHRPAWRILVPIFMMQHCLHFVDTFEALIYYIRWYKLKKGGPTLSVDSPNIDQHKKSALLCSKALSGAPSVGALRIQSCGLNLATSPRETNTSACAKCESVPEGMVRQKSRNIRCGFSWCTIGDSNPGPTD